MPALETFLFLILVAHWARSRLFCSNSLHTSSAYFMVCYVLLSLSYCSQKHNAQCSYVFPMHVYVSFR